MDDLALLTIAASGMEAQRAALDVAARNIAGAVAAGPHGTFERSIPQFRMIEANGTPEVVFTGAKLQRGSDVDTITEMVGVLNASRAFEANASVFEIGKQLALRTIDMSKV